jgi:FKBP-type peptidyl-prolyl cis-trans isomerase SlyD
MSLAITDGTWVRLRYRIRDAQGELLDEADRELTYLHGEEDALLPAVAHRLVGQQAGSKLSFQLEPEDAFGDYDAERVHLASRAHFPEDLEPGDSREGLPGQESDGLVYTVTDFTDDTVVLDGNHPLAGLALRFEIEVLEVGDRQFSSD